MQGQGDCFHRVCSGMRSYVCSRFHFRMLGCRFILSVTVVAAVVVVVVVMVVAKCSCCCCRCLCCCWLCVLASCTCLDLGWWEEDTRWMLLNSIPLQSYLRVILPKSPRSFDLHAGMLSRGRAESDRNRLLRDGLRVPRGSIPASSTRERTPSNAAAAPTTRTVATEFPWLNSEPNRYRQNPPYSSCASSSNSGRRCDYKE